VALLEDRPLYIFDEWAADQDPEFRRYYYEDLLPELKRRGKTVLAISHDDRYFHCADRVVFMDYGTIRDIRAGASA
jgi:putative ATP-binding cassette transporter